MMSIAVHIATVRTDVEVVNPLVIRLQSKFRVFWNLIVTSLLLYTSLWVPFQIAFIDEEDSVMNGMTNTLVDLCFAIDIIITFFSSYESHLGREETRLRFIAINYLSGWFFIDLLATIPTHYFETENSGRLTKLGRLPRLYRLTKILRLIKVLKTLTYNKAVSSIFNKFNLTSGRTRILKSVLLSGFLVHIIACFWFM